MSWPARAGSVAVNETTVAALATAALAGTLKRGLAFDENDVPYIVTSATEYYSLAPSAHQGTIDYATMIATPSPIAGMTARVPLLNRPLMYEYGYGPDIGAGPALGWWPQGGEQTAYNSAMRNFGVVTASARQICSIPLPKKSLVDGVYLACDWAFRKIGGTAENMVVHLQLTSLPSTYDAAKDFQTMTMNTTGIANTGQNKYAILTADTVFGRWGGGVISAPDGMVKGSTTGTVTPLTTPDLRTTDMYLNAWAISSAAVESLFIDQLRFRLGA